MGKLHTLRRAIERNPNRWKYPRKLAVGACLYRGDWCPNLWGASYRSFVAHVLREIETRDVGMTDDGPGDTAGATARTICR